MSGMAAAYYAQCTERDLSRRYKRTTTGNWLCSCGAVLTTTQTLDHKQTLCGVKNEIQHNDGSGRSTLTTPADRVATGALAERD